MFFFFGFGYVAGFLAKKLESLGYKFAGTKRIVNSETPRQILLSYEGGAFSEEIVSYLKKAEALLISIPPTGLGDVVIPVLKSQINILNHVKWIGYLSATNVYGDHKGAWVDEFSLTQPTQERGKNRLLAEQQWLALCQQYGLPVHIFRLAGIYGPGRNVISLLKESTTKSIYQENRIVSRIHVDDIVQALSASLLHPNPGAIYNVADDLPAPACDVLEYAANLLGIQPSAITSVDSAKNVPYNDLKRVCSKRIRKELGLRWIYPTYKEGLQALFRNQWFEGA